MSTILYNIFICLLIILIPYLIHIYLKNRRFWKLLDDFYGYKSLPFIGNAHQFGTTAEEYIWKSYDLFKDAGYKNSKLLIGSSVFVNICEPESVEVILSSTKEITKMTEYSYLKSWLGDGLLLSTGSKWKQRRRIITPAFHFRILEQFVKVFNDNGKILMKQLSKEKNKVIDIYTFINFYTLDVICETAMGVSINAQLEKGSEYVNAVNSSCKLVKQRIFSPLKRISWYYKLTDDYKQYTKDIKVLHSLTNEVIRTRKEMLKDQIERVKNGEIDIDNNQDEFIKKRKRIAFLDLLLLSRLPDGSFLSDEDIREETDTFMFEGHDTTTSAISFAIYSLANNPDAQEKALQEVVSILGDPNKDITYEHLQDMKYMELVIKETLRLYPSVPVFGRILENDVQLPDGKIIPAGCRVNVDAFGLGRHPLYYPDFEEFKPERFLPENTMGKNPYLFIPFSAGSRNCIGQRFAMLEVKCVLAKLLLNYELVTAGVDFKLRLASELIMKTMTGMHIILKDRKL